MNAEKAMIADDGKPGKSLKETSTEELKATLAKLKPTDPGAEARIKAIKDDLSARTPPDFEKAKQPSESTSLTPEKARLMLHERSGGHGRPITEQQRKFFGAVGGHLPAPGSKAKKSMGYEDLDDFLEKAATPIGGITPGGYKRIKKDQYVKVTKEEHAAHTAKEKERAAAFDPFKALMDPEYGKQMDEWIEEGKEADKPINASVQLKTMLDQGVDTKEIVGVMQDVPKGSILRIQYHPDDPTLTVRKVGSGGQFGDHWQIDTTRLSPEVRSLYTDKLKSSHEIVSVLKTFSEKSKVRAGPRPIPEPKGSRQREKETIKNLPEPKVSTEGGATVRKYEGMGTIRTEGDRHTVYDNKGVEQGIHYNMYSAQLAVGGMKKSMGDVMSLDDYMEKARRGTVVGGKTEGGYTVKMVGGKRVYVKEGEKPAAAGAAPSGITVDADKYINTIMDDADGDPEGYAYSAGLGEKQALQAGKKDEASKWAQKKAIADVLSKPEYKGMKAKRTTGYTEATGVSDLGQKTYKYKERTPFSAEQRKKVMSEATAAAQKAAQKYGGGGSAAGGEGLRSGTPDFKNMTQNQLVDIQESVMKNDPKKYEEVTGYKWEDRPKEWHQKSMDGIEGLEDYLEKSGGLPTHQQGMGHKKSGTQGASADGGELADVGRTSGSSDSAPGPEQDSQGQLKGVSPGGKQKLSDDDKEEDKQMTEHKKPIETIKKSAFPADQRESMAHEQAAAVSQLQKSEDVYIGPDRHPYSHQLTHASGDSEASELVKSEDFYHGGSPQTAPQRPIIEQGVLCKSVNMAGCGVVYSAALTSCPECGAGTVGHRHIPGGPVVGAETMILEKSNGPGPLLRRPPQEPDVQIG